MNPVKEKGGLDHAESLYLALNEERIDEYCEDIIAQQREGVSTHAMLMMKFNPECTPALNKVEGQCRIYDKYRERLDKAGAKHGVLADALNT